MYRMPEMFQQQQELNESSDFQDDLRSRRSDLQKFMWAEAEVV